MRTECEFPQARRSPHANQLKRSITMRLDEGTISNFRELAEEVEVPCQTLINLYLRVCAAGGRRLRLRWRPR